MLRRGGEEIMSRQSDNKTTIQVRIDAEVHRIAKLYAVQTKRTIKEVVDECVMEGIPKDFISKTNF